MVLRHSTAHVLAQAVQDVFPEAKLGIGPPIENGFYYDFDVARPFQPDDLEQAREADAGDRQVRAACSAAGGSTRVDQAKAELADEPYKLELVDIKGDVDARRGDGGRRRRADHLRQPRPEVRRALLGRPVPRPAPALDPADRRVQADAHRRGVLAGVGEEPAAAAHLRHRVADPGRAQGVPAAARGGRQARPPQAGRRPRPVQLPRGAGLRAAGVPPQGRHHPHARWRTTPGSGTSRRGTPSSTPRTSPRATCTRSPATWTGTPTACSRRWSWKARTTTSSR